MVSQLCVFELGWIDLLIFLLYQVFVFPSDQYLASGQCVGKRVLPLWFDKMVAANIQSSGAVLDSFIFKEEFK